MRDKACKFGLVFLSLSHAFLLLPSPAKITVCASHTSSFRGSLPITQLSSQQRVDVDADTVDDTIPDWYRLLQLFSAEHPQDALLRGADDLTWSQLRVRAENEWIANRIEIQEHRDSLSDKLSTVFDTMQSYAETHSQFAAVVVKDDNFENLVEKVKIYTGMWTEFSKLSARDRRNYAAAYVDFWSEMASVLRAQEDVPLEIPRYDLVVPLPYPFGQGAEGLVVLPTPEIGSWEQDGFGGTQQHMASLMIFKAETLPLLEKLRRSPSLEVFKDYAVMLGRVFRKGSRWFGLSERSEGFLEDVFEQSRMDISLTDPSRTGFSLPGIGEVSRRGVEDELLE